MKCYNCSNEEGTKDPEYRDDYVIRRKWSCRDCGEFVCLRCPPDGLFARGFGLRYIGTVQVDLCMGCANKGYVAKTD